MRYTRHWFSIALLATLAAGTLLRAAWPTADPPSHATLGIVWHDEGPWTHNARNRVLWGSWQTDNWNPMYVTPVFTGLEYVAFSLFGVGTWQARTVPALSGLGAVILLASGLYSTAGKRAAIAGAVLLATNYVFVMWNRAALMESTMTAFIVAAWAAYAGSVRRPAVGVLAGVAVVLAFFTKAAAAFFVGAVVLDAAFTIAAGFWPSMRVRLAIEAPDHNRVRGAIWTLAGLLVGTAAFAALFVLPNWADYQFYNWQMSVTRKPEYSVRALVDRASWLPIVHDFFTRMWLVMVAAALAMAGIVARWRSAPPGERLLVLWVLVGLLELVVHDSGNERRYVMFIPALVALTALVLADQGPLLPPLGRGARWLALPLLLLLAYLVVGAIARLVYLYEVGPSARLSGALAVLLVAMLFWKWPAVVRWISAQRLSLGGAAIVLVLAVTSDLAQYVQWTINRTSYNYEASRMLGTILPPGTLVHGKLANGLALENQIKPVFIGRGFGNYDDRLSRNDIRFVLTYVSPRVGYEGPVITEVLDAYPNRSTILTFPVAETRSGRDRAALIDKFGGRGAVARRAGPDAMLPGPLR